MIRAVVFDLGQVLSSPETLFTAPAELLGVDPDAFESLYWEGRSDYDAGGSDSDYWGPILTKLGKPAALETVQQLAALDARMWLGVRPAALQILRDVRAAEREVAVLTNSPTALDLSLLKSPVAEEADYWFVSASMGVMKPSKAAFYRVTEVLELEPAQIAFIDDRQPNVAAAEAFGWKAHLFSDDADTRAWLVTLGVLEP